MEICVVAETNSIDKEICEVLTSRIIKLSRPKEQVNFVKFEDINLSGKPRVIKFLPTVIELVARDFPNLNLLVVQVDCDGDFPTDFNEEKRKLTAQISKATPQPVYTTIISLPTKMIESWALSDILNINSIGSLSLSPFMQCEKITEPKNDLGNVYKLYKDKAIVDGKEYGDKNSFKIELFQNINIETLKNNSKSFEKLIREFDDFLR